jgi:hypothetical protein
MNRNYTKFSIIMGILVIFTFVIVSEFSNNIVLNEDILIVDTNNTELQVNSQNLPIVHTDAQYVLHSFENNIKNQGVAVLATVESVETKLVDHSRNETKYVYKEGYKELQEELVKKLLNNEITNNELYEILLQQRTGETYTEHIENKIPVRFITLKVDQYLADITGKFTDTLIVKTSGYGEGVRDGKAVYYGNYKNMEYLIGEQSIYVLTDLIDPEYLVLDGFTGKYTINNNGMIQSKFNQYILEPKITDNQVAQILDGTITSIENQTIDYTVEWNLPIHLDEALTIGTQIGEEWKTNVINNND